MQRLEVSGAVRPIYTSLGVKGLKEVSRRRLTAVEGVRSRASTSGICGGQSGMGQFSPPVLLFAPVRIIPATLHTNLRLNIILIKRTSGRSLGNLKKSRLFVGNRSSTVFPIQCCRSSVIEVVFNSYTIMKAAV
jgi:hypothetical protein